MDSKDRPAVWAERKSNDNGNSESRRTENRSEEHTSELQSQSNLVCRLLLEKKNIRAMLLNNVQDVGGGQLPGGQLVFILTDSHAVMAQTKDRHVSNTVQVLRSALPSIQREG